MRSLPIPALLACLGLLPGPHCPALEPLRYNHPGLVVDLGVGLWAWPLPMDFDGDGDLDLVVNCPDKPSNGVYFFENPGPDTSVNKMPVFKPGRRISAGLQNVQLSEINGQPVVLTPGQIHPDFKNIGLANPAPLHLPPNPHPRKGRANMWRMVDFDGDGLHDLIAGIDDWSEYGWDNAYNAHGEWIRGPLRGFVYWMRNHGSNTHPAYEPAVQIQAGTVPMETFGWPSPNFADFDNDGDLDCLCGEFLDGFTYFENTGSRSKPAYAKGRRLTLPQGANGFPSAWLASRETTALAPGARPLTMDLEMITPVAIDWDRDGDPDLIVGDEDGRVAFLENTGKPSTHRTPQFLPPRYFQQEADTLKCGALATPFGFDWDGDGDMDILSGNTAGYIHFFENLSGPGIESPRWAAPRPLGVHGTPVRILAGYNGSIQGPCEAKWGYTTLSVADWDADGLPDLVVNSILGRVVWHRNTGTRTAPELAPAQAVEVEWENAPPTLSYVWLKPEGRALLTQWRTTPLAVDWNQDGLTDLVMLDTEGYLSLFPRTRKNGTLALLPPRRVLFADPGAVPPQGRVAMALQPGQPLRPNPGLAGKSGRRKFAVTDWNGDGALDFLLNSANANLLQQTRQENGQSFFQDHGPLENRNIEGHDVSPATVDFNGDSIPDFLGGAEDGRFYYLRNPRTP